MKPARMMPEAYLAQLPEERRQAHQPARKSNPG